MRVTVPTRSISHISGSESTAANSSEATDSSQWFRVVRPPPSPMPLNVGSPGNSPRDGLPYSSIMPSRVHPRARRPTSLLRNVIETSTGPDLLHVSLRSSNEIDHNSPIHDPFPPSLGPVASRLPQNQVLAANHPNNGPRQAPRATSPFQPAPSRPQAPHQRTRRLVPYPAQLVQRQDWQSEESLMRDHGGRSWTDSLWSPGSEDDFASPRWGAYSNFGGTSKEFEISKCGNAAYRHLRLAFSMDSGEDILYTPQRGMWDPCSPSMLNLINSSPQCKRGTSSSTKPPTSG